MEIILYTIPTCPWSKKLRTWLRRRRIKFEERDPTEESEFYDEIIEKSWKLVTPVIDINGEIVVGFQEKAIKKLIDEAKEKDKLSDEAKQNEELSD